jgi:hypothetical protein
MSIAVKSLRWIAPPLLFLSAVRATAQQTPDEALSRSS